MCSARIGFQLPLAWQVAVTGSCGTNPVLHWTVTDDLTAPVATEVNANNYHNSWVVFEMSWNVNGSHCLEITTSWWSIRLLQLVAMGGLNTHPVLEVSSLAWLQVNEICSPTQVVNTPFSLAGVDTNDPLAIHPGKDIHMIRIIYK